MTDEQILKKLAEIEKIGRNARDFEVHEWGCCWYDAEGSYRSWSPLTNWSDLGPLIEKYVQTIEKHADSPNIREYWRGKYTVLTLDDAGVATHESLPHAICLAIIEAKGGMRDE